MNPKFVPIYRVVRPSIPVIGINRLGLHYIWQQGKLLRADAVYPRWMSIQDNWPCRGARLQVTHAQTSEALSYVTDRIDDLRALHKKPSIDAYSQIALNRTAGSSIRREILGLTICLPPPRALRISQRGPRPDTGLPHLFKALSSRRI